MKHKLFLSRPRKWLPQVRSYLAFKDKKPIYNPQTEIEFLTYFFFKSGFSDANRGQQQHFFGEDPSQYVDEVKQSLAGERGLSPRNRDLVMEVLGRLADRVQSAENSRNAVVNELVSLRERFVVRITEIIHWKCLRRLGIFQID